MRCARPFIYLEVQLRLTKQHESTCSWHSVQNQTGARPFTVPCLNRSLVSTKIAAPFFPPKEFEQDSQLAAIYFHTTLFLIFHLKFGNTRRRVIPNKMSDNTTTSPAARAPRAGVDTCESKANTRRAAKRSRLQSHHNRSNKVKANDPNL